jgi:hypothetical protein
VVGTPDDFRREACTLRRWYKEGTLWAPASRSTQRNTFMSEFEILILGRLSRVSRSRARHGFANPRGYPGMGGTGTGTGRLKVTHRKPTPVARVWRVFPGTRITKRHMRHISLPPPTSIRPQTQQHAQDMSPNTTTRRWGGGEKDEGGDGPSCPSP